MAGATLEEEILLRALTGRVVGTEVMKDYNKIAIISEDSLMCTATSTAVEASYLSKNNFGNILHIIVKENGVKDVADKVIDYDPGAVLLMFSGEGEESTGLFVKTLKSLSEAMVETDVILHERIFSSGGLQEALKDEGVAEYLEETPLFVYTADLDGGMMVLNEIYIEGGNVELDPLEHYPLTLQHVELLKKSLRKEGADKEE